LRLTLTSTQHNWPKQINQYSNSIVQSNNVTKKSIQKRKKNMLKRIKCSLVSSSTPTTLKQESHPSIHPSIIHLKSTCQVYRIIDNLTIQIEKYRIELRLISLSRCLISIL